MGCAEAALPLVSAAHGAAALSDPRSADCNREGKPRRPALEKRGESKCVAPKLPKPKKLSWLLGLSNALTAVTLGQRKGYEELAGTHMPPRKRRDTVYPCLYRKTASKELGG